MPNTTYWLNIDDKFIEMYSNFLWTWNPDIAEIWFIWLEEKFKEKEFPLKKIIDDKLNCDCNNEFTIDNKFTKKFLEIHGNDDFWIWFKIMAGLSNKIQSDLFIWESFFLPCNSWGLLFDTYWWKNKKYRNTYYSANNLQNLLNTRGYIFCSLIKKVKNRMIIFYWNDSYRVKALNDLLKRNWIISTNVFLDFESLKESEEDKKKKEKKKRVQSFNYWWNIIFLIDFITSNIFNEEQKKYLKTDLNIFYQINYKRDLFSGLHTDWILTWERCPDDFCNWEILQKEIHESSSNDNEPYIKYCNKCWNEPIYN